MADPSPPASTKEEAEKAAAKKVRAYTWGCLFILIGGCVAIMNCPESTGPSCGREYAVREAAEERREALEDRARAAIGLERLLVQEELVEARATEAAADRAWRACIGR